MRKVSIIIPVIRPEKAARCVNAIQEFTSNFKDCEVYWLEDSDGIGCPRMVEKLTSMTQYDLVMFLGDDTIPQPGFLQAALKEMESLPDGWGVVGLNTTPGNDHAHWLADKAMLHHILGGAFFPTEYRHCYCDDELKDIAVELGRFAFAEDARIEHDHPINKTGEEKEKSWDEGYQKAYDDVNLKADMLTYHRRKIDRTRARQGVRLGIGLPLTDDRVFSQFMLSFLGLRFPEKGYDLFMPHFPGRVDAIRNNLVGQALHSGCTHLLMMDTDQTYYTPDMIERMLSHDKPVIGAKVHRRYPPFDPLLLRNVGGRHMSVDYHEIDHAVADGAIVEVDATGCGCILYDMRVFLDIDPPWFEFKKTEDGRTVGEDVGFCKKLKDAGYPIFVDCSIEIAHLTVLEVGMDTFRVFRKLKFKEKVKQNELGKQSFI